VSEDLIDERASRWLAARDAGSLAPNEAEELNRWLEADIRHRVAYLRLEAAWRRAERLRDLRPYDRAPDPDLLAAPARNRRWPIALAASLVLSLLAGAWAWQNHWSWQKYETEVGGFERVLLEDGSVTDSDVRVRLRDSRREIRLLRGEGRFQVAPDAARPFTVAAAGADVRAVGTAFTVRVYDSAQVDVLVAEGKVAVASEHVQRTPPLNAGESAVVLPDRVSVSRIEPQALARRLAWTSGRLDFRGESLADAVREFNRYNRRKIVIRNPDIAALRVGGSFTATDPGSFASALGSAFDVRVAEDGENIVLR
jgi:transmembrane sensor